MEMEWYNISLFRFFIVLVAVYASSSCSSASPCLSVDTEFIYDYESEVQVGIEDAVDVTSLYKLKGQLVVHSNLNSVKPVECNVFQLKNIKYYSYHGNLENKEEKEDLYESAPPESSDIHLPFFASYMNGTFDSINVNRKEHDWSVNMKKALVNAFQVHYNALTGSATAFTSVENSIYGLCKPDYSSYSTDFGLVITKIYFASLCKDSYIHSLDVEGALPQKGVNYFQDFNGMKKYKVNTVQFRHPYIESIEATEKLHNSYYGDMGHKTLVLTKQNIVLKSVNNNSQLQNELLFEEGGITEMYKEIKDLKYYQATSENPFGLLYITNGRGNFQESQYEMVIKKFEELVDYVQKSHFTEKLRNIKQERKVSELLMHFRYLNVEEIKNVYKTIFSDSTKYGQMKRNLFFEVISVVGTKSSIKFITDFLKTGEIDDVEAVDGIVMNMAFYVLNYTKEIVEDAQVLLKLPKSVDEDIQLDSILSFSIMFGKLCGGESGTNAHQCDSEFVNSIANHFFNGVINNEQSYMKQLVYVEGLKNLNVLQAVSYLEKIITKEVKVNDDLRLRAMMSPHPITKYPSKVYNVYMPILANIKEPLEMRAVALQMLVECQLGDPEYRPFSLHWHMSGETSPRLYNYYYTLLKSYGDSINPQHQKKKTTAMKILQITKKPTEAPWDSSAVMYNYISPNFGYGSEFIFRAFGNGEKVIPNMMYAEVSSISSNGLVNGIGLHLRLKGVEDIFVQYLVSNLKFPTHPLNNFPTEFLSFQDHVMTEPLHAEMVFQQKGYTYTVLTVGTDDDNESSDDFSKPFWAKYKNINEQMVLHLELSDRIYMTDIGVPVVLNIHYPMLFSSIANFDTIGDYFKINMDIGSFATGETNLLAFNPIANKWHGISRVQSSDFQLPISAQIKFDTKEKEFELSIQKSDGDGHIGWQVAAKTYAAIFSGDSAIPSDFVVVKKGIFNNSQELFKNLLKSAMEDLPLDCSPVGYDIILGFSGSEVPKGIYSFVSSRKDIYSTDDDDEEETLSLLKELTMFDLASTYLSYLPEPGEWAARVSAIPKLNNSDSKFSISMKIKGNEVGGKVPLPGYKLNALTKIKLYDSAANDPYAFYIDTDIDYSPRGVHTAIKSKFTSSSKGENSGKPLILSYEKDFPQPGSDAFVYGWGDETVRTKISFSSCNSNNEDECQKFEATITGEISDEQKYLAESNIYPYNQCKKDKEKPEWQGSLVPRTWACYQGALQLFYTRKVSVDYRTKNIPVSKIASSRAVALKKYLSDINIDHILTNNTDDNLSVIAVYSATEPTANIEVKTNREKFNFRDVPQVYETDLFNILLDNTHFSRFLRAIESTGIIRECIANSASVMTSNNSTIEHQFGSDYDTLSKIIKTGKYGVYAKKLDSGLVAKVVIGDAVLEINGNTVTFNGKALQNIEEGYQYPNDTPMYYFRVWSNEGQVTLYSRRFGVYIIYSPVSITVSEPIILKGFVTGLCSKS